MSSNPSWKAKTAGQSAWQIEVVQRGARLRKKAQRNANLMVSVKAPAFSLFWDSKLN